MENTRTCHGVAYGYVEMYFLFPMGLNKMAKNIRYSDENSSI